ncbi:hypothetical protein TNCV_4558381 [Trichonephila clavipes]|nr:hypothetical protein TNCV_4558381 [Trichonephila clavipes]
MVDIDILMEIWKNRVKKIDFVLKWLSRVGSEVGPTKGFCEGYTRNRWRDGQVCPDVEKELWRLGPDGSVNTPLEFKRVLFEEGVRHRERPESPGERTDGRRRRNGKDGSQRERGDGKREKEGRGDEKKKMPAVRDCDEASLMTPNSWNPSCEKCWMQVSPIPACDECIMTFLLRERKDLLLKVAKVLSVEIGITLPKIEFKKIICQSKYYDEESVKCLLEGILEEKREEREKQEIKEFEECRLARELELERMRVQLRNKLN